MTRISLNGWSFIVAVLALVVATIAAVYTRAQYNLAYDQDQRAITLKKPMLDVFPKMIDARHWKITITLDNRSDTRIMPNGITIPSPDGGFINVTQTEPVGTPAYILQANSETPFQQVGGRVIPQGAKGVWTGTYDISDAFPAKFGAQLTLNMLVVYLDSQEKAETLTTTRNLE